MLIDPTADELTEALLEDDYGLAEWFVLREGAEEPPFSTIRASRPDLWPLLVNSVQRRQRGSVG